MFGVLNSWQCFKDVIPKIYIDMPRVTQALSPVTRENKIKRLQKHLKRKSKGKLWHANDNNAKEKLALLQKV
jgi:hypothetical protein